MKALIYTDDLICDHLRSAKAVPRFKKEPVTCLSKEKTRGFCCREPESTTRLKLETTANKPRQLK